MSANSYADLRSHVGHRIECVVYGDENVAVECITCCEVLLDYEEDCEIDGKPMPEWLLNLCYKARDTYGCNWILLDPDAEPIPGLPTYEHP